MSNSEFSHLEIRTIKDTFFVILKRVGWEEKMRGDLISSDKIISIL